MCSASLPLSPHHTTSGKGIFLTVSRPECPAPAQNPACQKRVTLKCKKKATESRRNGREECKVNASSITQNFIGREKLEMNGITEEEGDRKSVGTPITHHYLEKETCA